MMRRICLSPEVFGSADECDRSPSATPLRVQRRILIAGGAALCALLVPAMHHPGLRLVWNVSASVPVGLYRIVPGTAFRSGELVAVRPPPVLAHYMASRRYVEDGALLVKPIGALPGQQVCRVGAALTVDGAKVATALVADRLHRPLPAWRGCLRLRPGAIFLLAPQAPASFDGRYFGVVPVTGIVGRALPIWTKQ